MRFFMKIKNWKTVRGWHIWKLKLVDARLYFVSMIVGLLTGLIAVCYHYLLYFLLHIRSDFSHPVLPGIGIYSCSCCFGGF